MTPFEHEIIDLHIALEAWLGKGEGEADALPGWRRDWLEITDPAVLAASGERFHPVVSRSDDAADTVEGTVFRISADELAAADRYEVSDYVRVLASLRSGRQAWVYVRA